MKATWPRSIALLMDSEGPELNIGGSEPGGASRRGVSVSAFGDLHKKLGLPLVTVDTIRNLTDDQAEDFYRQVTAVACRFDDLPSGVDYVMLDVTTNLGPSGGSWLLQNVLGQWPLVNTITDEVVSLTRSMSPTTLITAIGAAWIAKKHESPGWAKSGHGWNNRMMRVRGDALAMIEGTEK